MFTAADSQQAVAASAAAAAAATSTAAENQAARAASSSSNLASPIQSSQRSIFEYGSTPDEFAQLRRTMTCMVPELTRLKSQTAADVDTTEALATLVKQAKELRQLPAPKQTLLSADIRNLYIRHCGNLQLRRQPYRGCWRDLRTVTHIACRALVSAVQTFLSAREPLHEETFPFLTKLLVTTTTTQHTLPRTVQELHIRLNEAETLPSAPFGRYDPDEQLFNAHAWYSMTMLASLELPDVPFHVLLSTHLTATALQDVVMQHRTAFAQAASEQRHCSPTCAEVCEVLQQFYDDPHAQHLKQDWVVKALSLPDARR